MFRWVLGAPKLFKKLLTNEHYRSELKERLKTPSQSTVRKVKIALVLINTIPLIYAIKYSDSAIKLKTSLTRRASRYYGYLVDIELPIGMRSKVHRFYSWVTGADLTEVAKPLEEYETLGKFFARELVPGARPINLSDLVCPCDGKVLSYGVVKNDVLEHIKGGTYSLTHFLTGSAQLSQDSFITTLKSRAETQLYYVTFYLAPGDYHRFHSPADVIFYYRSHLHGYLLGVFPLNLWRKKSIFEINERVAYFGKWKEGFLTFVAVGAYNVGSIKINFDTELQTNHKSPSVTAEHLKMSQVLQKGQEVGSFNMGSSIVLVFEALPGLKWEIEPGQSVKMGQALAT
mmetsp:Transcript_34469/g.60494  ORF Transcript_34469/g.60494 Transcript_34469/m.60494 type:complete len:344 (-) Transcript_34469:1865-2896(-)